MRTRPGLHVREGMFVASELIFSAGNRNVAEACARVCRDGLYEPIRVIGSNDAMIVKQLFEKATNSVLPHVRLKQMLQFDGKFLNGVSCPKWRLG